jgi:hypothetical protein
MRRDLVTAWRPDGGLRVVWGIDSVPRRSGRDRGRGRRPTLARRARRYRAALDRLRTARGAPRALRQAAARPAGPDRACPRRPLRQPRLHRPLSRVDPRRRRAEQRRPRARHDQRRARRPLRPVAATPRSSRRAPWWSPPLRRRPRSAPAPRVCPPRGSGDSGARAAARRPVSC